MDSVFTASCFPVCQFFISFSLLLLEAEVTNQRKMVRWIAKGWKPVGPNLFLTGHVQYCVDSQCVLSVPDVVQSGAAFPCGPNLPRRVLWLSQTILTEFLVCRVQTQRRRSKSFVHLFSWDCVEVATNEQRNVRSRRGVAGVFLNEILKMSQEVRTLGASEPLPARTSLQVGHSNAQASPCAPAA